MLFQVSWCTLTSWHRLLTRIYHVHMYSRKEAPLWPTMAGEDEAAQDYGGPQSCKRIRRRLSRSMDKQLFMARLGGMLCTSTYIIDTRSVAAMIASQTSSEDLSPSPPTPPRSPPPPPPLPRYIFHHFFSGCSGMQQPRTATDVPST